MPIKVQCSSCGVSLTTPDTFAGKRATCPKCGQVIQIPEAQAEEEVLDAEESLFDGLTDDEMASGEVTQDDRRPCPACGEMILRRAVKCRFCDSIFDETLEKREKKKLKKESAAAGDDDLSTGEWVVAIICSGIGCIMGIIWMIQGKPKGKKMFLVSICVQIFWVLLRTIIQRAAQNAGP